jgi:hypothetical protein
MLSLTGKKIGIAKWSKLGCGSKVQHAELRILFITVMGMHSRACLPTLPID